MLSVIIYTIASVFLVSLISLIGIFFLGVKVEKLQKFLIYMISFSAGALLGDAFIHLLPETVEKYGFKLSISLYVLLGILIFFILEKIIKWQHCHLPITKHHVHSFAYMNIVGDGLHNFIDGLIIAASYLVNIHVGIATTIAVVLHEIPQEIGEFGLLVYGGFSKTRALFVNFLSALTAIIGAVVGLWISSFVPDIQLILVPIAAGGFIYIASSDLIPELHKETRISRSIGQIIAFLVGIAVMVILLGL